jgi:hypothetical protein
MRIGKFMVNVWFQVGRPAAFRVYNVLLAGVYMFNSISEYLATSKGLELYLL